MIRGRFSAQAASAAIAFAIIAGAAGCGPSAEQVAQAKAQAAAAQERAERAQAAARKAREAAIKARIAADQAQQAVDDATRESDRVAAHIYQMRRERDGASGE